MAVAGRNETIRLIEHKLFQMGELREECKSQYEEKIAIEQKISNADAILKAIAARQLLATAPEAAAGGGSGGKKKRKRKRVAASATAPAEGDEREPQPCGKKRRLLSTQHAAAAAAGPEASAGGGLAAGTDKKLLACLTAEYARGIRHIDQSIYRNITFMATNCSVLYNLCREFVAKNTEHDRLAGMLGAIVQRCQMQAEAEAQADAAAKELAASRE